jgi:hypothetical protein
MKTEAFDSIIRHENKIIARTRKTNRLSKKKIIMKTQMKLEDFERAVTIKGTVLTSPLQSHSIVGF